MPSEPDVPPGLTYQLRFEKFKQIATLAVVRYRNERPPREGSAGARTL